MPAYEFTEDWFSRHAGVWRQILERFAPRRLLEIGSYEGCSACFLIDECGKAGPVDLHCIDTWQGGIEHDPATMAEVEARFDRNLDLAVQAAPNPVTVTKHKAASTVALAHLMTAEPAAGFDLIYIDGSHQAPVVLADAVMAFQLLRVGGIMIFDDYLWSRQEAGQQDFYDLPKPAIDAFVNIYQRKLGLIGAPLYQLYAQKIAS
ncbi:class I SAM-dependent methyltransferase [Phenylobacterium sp.]|jgi:predicted O-methyltransferase YrrM|uniref:class I SAM-dependent methyltransferase n=1 Tax=Phenylobacterium sp. TaxID=1871053 RepID=UPI002E36E846|nr:class I SAM-dependent methyltransferase [Phenylobacterium sp.]HEX3365752.1 class I SAM-dependent methyltransferase [Phenylobacterium sp.]